MRYINYILFFFLFSAFINAQDMRKTVIPHQQQPEELMHRQKIAHKYTFPDNPKNFIKSGSGQIITLAEGFYKPSLVIAYMQTDSGIVKTKDSLQYNSTGDQILGIYQVDEGNGWVNSYKDTSYYEEKGEITEYVWESYNWADTIWDKTAKGVYGYSSECVEMYFMLEQKYMGMWEKRVADFVYDDNGNLRQTVLSKGAGDSLEAYQRQSYEYDSEGRETSNLTEYWENGAWVAMYRALEEYNDQGYEIRRTYEAWELMDWVKTSQETYTWDPAGYMLTSIYKIRGGDSLVNYDSAAYAYTPEGKNKSLTRFYWEDSIWVSDIKYDYEYGEYGIISYQKQDWKDSVWSNETRETYTYDNKGNMTTFLFEKGLEDTLWVNDSKSEYVYDEAGNPVQAENFVWMNVAWIQGNGYLRTNSNSYNAYFLEAEYVYIGDPVSAGDDELLPVKFELTQNYPNPFNPETKINFTIPLNGKTTLKVYDILGREVAALINGEMEKGTHTVNFNGRNLSSGVYIYRLQAGSFTESKKMALIK
ncbi:MAG TPA: T9SS type A sorting domain-containing protein [Ignavibacteriales bacterium]|nr:T9SS type A sorting domain-containing protein [Ignavibacteriales bacterium]